jgi:hypothetical protein
LLAGLFIHGFGGFALVSETKPMMDYIN